MGNQHSEQLLVHKPPDLKTQVIGQFKQIKELLKKSSEDFSGNIKYATLTESSNPTSSQPESRSAVVLTLWGPVLIEYSIRKDHPWFKKPISHIVMMVSLGGEPLEAVTYSLLDKEELPSSVVEEHKKKFLSLILRFSFQENEEWEIVSNIEQCFCWPGFSNSYYSQKHIMKAEKLAATLAKAVETLSSSIDKVADSFIESLPEDPQKLIDNYVVEQKQKIDSEITSQQAHYAKVYAEKHTKLEKEIQALREKAQADLEKQRLELAKKIELCDAKLAEHRKAISLDFFKVIPALSEIFPDYSGTSSGPYYYGKQKTKPSYDDKVDGHLRTFYAGLIQKDLEDNQHISVDELLSLVKLIRETCFPKNRRPCGSELREIYRGVRAVLDFLTKFDVTASQAISLLVNEAKSKKTKPEVEEFIEAALHYDFEMKRYDKGLHPADAVTKKDLGVR